MPLVIDLTGPEPVVISGIPSRHAKDDHTDVLHVRHGCRAPLAKNGT